jgi:hypothetical protein
MLLVRILMLYTFVRLYTRARKKRRWKKKLDYLTEQYSAIIMNILHNLLKKPQSIKDAG